MEIFLLSPKNDRHDKIIYIFPLLRGWLFEPCYKLKARTLLIVSVGWLRLVRDRLIRLGWTTPASPNQFLRFLVFSHSLFCFRRTAMAQLFRLL